MDKNEKKMSKKNIVMPGFEQFKMMMEKARAAVYEKPGEIKPGQIWGIAGKDYRFVVLSSPETSITGKDVRVVPVINKIHMATEADVILPEDFVFYSESVLMPFQVTNIMLDKLDLYHGELKKDITDFLIKTDNKGELAPLPNFTRQGSNDPYDPIIFEYSNNLRDELFGFAQEVFLAADLLQEEDEVTVFEKLVQLVSEFRDRLEEFIAVPGVPVLQTGSIHLNFESLEEDTDFVISDEEDFQVLISFTSSKIVFSVRSKNFQDDRTLNGFSLVINNKPSQTSYNFDPVKTLKNRIVDFTLPADMVESIKKSSGFVISFELAGKQFTYQINY